MKADLCQEFFALYMIFFSFFRSAKPVVRKNSIRLLSDRDAGTYLFGFPALGSPKNQSCEHKMLLSRADPVQS